MNDHFENLTKRPLIVRFFRWLFSWRIIRRMLVALAGLITLLALFITEENWRGKRAWENYKRAAEARGERFDMASLVPPVPDDQNFFCAPIVSEALNALQNVNPYSLKPHGTNRVNRMEFTIYRGEMAYWVTNVGNWQKGRLMDLKEWQAAFRRYSETPEAKTNGFPIAAQPQTPAADVLLALSSFNPALEELRQASLRPYARIPLNYENGFDAAGELLPWLANMKRCAQFLQLRILAELENGQSEPALEDIKLLLRVTDSVREQPFLISHLVRIAMTAINLQPIYEGLAQHRWSDAQLAELEQVLARQDYLADFEFAMRGEKITAIASFENQRLTRKMIVPQDNGENKPLTVSMRFMPSAFFYQNELAFAQMHQQWSLSLVNMETRIVSPEALRRVDAEVGAANKHYSPYKVLARMLNPAIRAAVIKFAIIQGQVDLAHVGCALERYRLAHAEYPESLDALAPQFIAKIPREITNGQPLHYRRNDDGQFILYSVGWNETDDGGVVGLRKTGTVDFGQGDWVWQYPIK